MTDTEAIVLGAESVRSELHEAPETHNLTEAQAEYIQQLPTEDIARAVRDVVDDYFWKAYDSVRRDAIARLAQNHEEALGPLGDDLVCIVHVTGENYESAVDAANDEGGSIEAVVAHLAQWDYGHENDDAAEVNGRDGLSDLEALPHQLHEIDHEGLHYWLQTDHGLGFYALYRRPL